MAEFSDYTSLAATAKTSLGRDVIAGAVTLLVADMNRELRIREMLTEVTQSTLTLPADYLEMETLKVGGIVYLPQNETAQSRGDGKTYSIHNGTLLFNPAETAPDLFMRYYAKIPTITGSETTATLSSHPDVWLLGLMAFHARLTRDEKGAAAWGSAYREALDDARVADVNSRMAAVAFEPRARSVDDY